MSAVKNVKSSAFPKPKANNILCTSVLCYTDLVLYYIDLLVSSKKHTSISLCVTVFLTEALSADIPNPQLFQNKIFIDK
jgi:hypothetical protein